MGDYRTLEPVDPSERPHRRRRTARVLLLDRDERILLFQDSDPGLPGRRWWITPGGGIDEGESERQGAAREVREETGLVVEPESFVGPLARRTVWHGYTDVVVEQEDVFFGLVVDAFDVDVSGHTEEERLLMMGHRWWRRAELEHLELGADTVWPGRLLEIWDVLLTRAGPLDLGVEEESTLAVEGLP